MIENEFGEIGIDGSFLKEAGIEITWNNNEIAEYYTGALTWDGHKFLDTIRDNEFWSKTKQITSRFASVSISMIESIASQVISNLIAKQMKL